MSYTFDKTAYLRMGPDRAEGEIGGSILSELLEGDQFAEMPDDYDLIYYLSRKQMVGGDYGGPVSVVAIYREGLPDQRVFTLDYEKFTQDIEDESLTGYPEDWVEPDK